MQEIESISVADDFSRFPGPRMKRDGQNSGEAFREFLVEKIASAKVRGVSLHIILDGTAGYGVSFLEEAFGGLIRNGQLKFSDVGTQFVIVAISPPFLPYKYLAIQYMKSAAS